MVFDSYYNAKLLLTSEYLVLNGAEALAVPLRFGQRLCVATNGHGFISWQSVAHDGSTWFSGKYSLSDFSISKSSDPAIAKYPQRLLLAARKLSPGFCLNSEGIQVVCTLNYPLLWGLGSSSTLIAAVAGWAGIDPFDLHFEVSKGSGYDIACALSKGPILYSLKTEGPEYKAVDFSPSFASQVYFVYQGKKQDSAEGIQKYRHQKPDPGKNNVDHASALTTRMLGASILSEFESVMREHETLISSITGLPGIRQTRFSDLPGEVKSLGAWGGDFCMLTWHDKPGLLPVYLKSKGLGIWFNFHDIVL